MSVKPHLAHDDMTGLKELDNTLGWKTCIGDNVRKIIPAVNMQHVIQCDDYPTKQKKKWVFEMLVVEISDREIGMSNGHKYSKIDPKIKETKVLRFEISAALAKKITKNKVEDSVAGCVLHQGSSRWQLEFDYKLHYRWAGMLQFFEVQIPFGGYFPTGVVLSEDQMHIERFEIIGDCNVAADAGDEMDWVEA